MRAAIFKNTVCFLIFILVIYLIYVLSQPKKMKPLAMQKYHALEEVNNNNTTLAFNNSTSRSQQNQPDVDRLPLVEENSVIVPANEIIQMSYQDCTMNKDLYTKDAPLFSTDALPPIEPLDINDSTHRRVNFY